MTRCAGGLVLYVACKNQYEAAPKTKKKLTGAQFVGFVKKVLKKIGPDYSAVDASVPYD